MSTNLEVVTTALRMIGVIDSNESPAIEDGTLALHEMNDLFEVLAADGIDLGYPPQDSLSDDFPLDGRTEAQIKPILAMALLVHYPSARPVDTLPARAAKSTSQLKLAAVLANIEQASLTNIPLGESAIGRINILTGE